MALGTRIKANNTNALNLTTSWTSGIVPDSNYIGFWEATYQAGSATLALGASMSWAGIGVINPGSNVNIGTTTATLTLGADGIDMNSATRDLSILSPVTVSLGANQQWTVTSARTLTVSSSITGTGNLTKAGSGDLVLTGTGNSFSGTFTASGGTTYCVRGQAGTPNQLSTVASVSIASGAAVLVSGGTAATLGKNISGAGSFFSGNTGFTVQSPADLSGLTGTFYQYSSAYDLLTNANTKTTFSSAAAFPVNAGLIGYRQNSTSPTMTIAYTGSGNVTTTGNWNFFNFTGGTGAWTAVLQHYGTSGATFTIGGTGKTISADGSYNLTWQLDVSSTGALNVNNNILQPAGSGVLSIQKLGTGPAVLAGANTFTGTVTVSAGTLNANSATALGADQSSGTVANGATLSAGAALNYSTRNFTITGMGVSNAGALVINHAGAVNVGAITLGGATLIRGTADGGSLTSNITNTQNLTLGVDSGKTVTFSGTINTGTGTLTIGETATSTGTVVLSQASTRSGANTLTFGTVRVGNATALGSGSITFNGGGIDASTTLTLTNSLTVSANITFGGTADLTLSSNISLGADRTVTTNGSVGALTLSGIISGSTFKLTKAGTNTLTLTSVNTFTGAVDVTAGTLNANNARALGGTTGGDIFVRAGATLVLNSATSTNYTSKFLRVTSSFANNAGLVINNTGDNTFGAVLFNTPTAYVRATAAGTATLTGTLNVTESLAYIGAASGSTLVCTSGISVVTSGDIVFGKQATDTGIVELRGAGGYVGQTQIDYGTVRCANLSPFGTGGVGLSANTTLQTLTAGGQNGKLTVASLNNAAGGIIKIGG